jgi:hypothetical protein
VVGQLAITVLVHSADNLVQFKLIREVATRLEEHGEVVQTHMPIVVLVNRAESGNVSEIVSFLQVCFHLL